MRRRLTILGTTAALLMAAAPAGAVHSGCVNEAEPRTDDQANCEQMPPPPDQAKWDSRP